MNLASQSAHGPRYRWLWTLVFAFPILVYCWVLSQYAVNVPLFDDHAFKAFLLAFRQADWLEKLRLIFSQHNEHRIAYDRLVVVLTYYSTGQINYLTYMWVGNTSLIGILAVFVSVGRRKQLPLSIICAFPYLLFSLVHHENTFWGMASLQNFTVLWWVVLSLWALSLHTKRTFVLACVAAVFATFTSGNGLLTFGIGLGVLILQRRWVSIAPWLMIAGACAGCYFADYQRPPGNPTEAFSATILELSRGFLAFVGGLADTNFQLPLSLRLWICAGLGSLLLTIAGCFLVKALLQSPLISRQTSIGSLHYFLIALFGFLLLTAGLVTITRLGFGAATLLTSRYKINASLFGMAALLALFGTFSLGKFQHRLALGTLAGVVLMWGLQLFFQLDEVIYHRAYMLSSMNNSLIGAKPNPSIPYFPPRYLIPAPTSFSPKPLSVQSSDSAAEATYEILISDCEEARSTQHQLFWVLSSSRDKWMFPVRRNRLSLWGFVRTADYYNADISVSIPRAEVPSGTYSQSLLIVNGTESRSIPIAQPLVAVYRAGASTPVNW